MLFVKHYTEVYHLPFSCLVFIQNNNMGVKNIKVNKPMSKIINRHSHHPWAKGFKQGNKVIYHPYTRIGFEFGDISNNLWPCVTFIPSLFIDIFINVPSIGDDILILLRVDFNSFNLPFDSM